ncbi:Hypothetical protein FKW44_016034 [Caligus rogercresseyi]|uniref:Uncharacterized protein n=1 Tax=Caligus rogercresseyi TaxID=217165 RepID=A0A7T8H153_CALRO|nr:Hypothetical protein FKW44_016034 [Caligus rogercresseyi]
MTCAGKDRRISSRPLGYPKDNVFETSSSVQEDMVSERRAHVHGSDKIRTFLSGLMRFIKA